MDNTQLIQLLQQLAQKSQQGAQQGSVMPQMQLPQLQQPQAGGHLFSGDNSLWNTINDRRNATQLPTAYNGQDPVANTQNPSDPSQGSMLNSGGGMKDQIKKGLISKIFSMFE